jgi:hypothetical protein
VSGLRPLILVDAGAFQMRVATRRQLADALVRAIKSRGRFQLVEIMLQRGAIRATRPARRLIFTTRRSRRPAGLTWRRGRHIHPQG